MELKRFIDIVKNAKPSLVYTGSASYKLKVATNKEHTIQKIYTRYECSHCNTNTERKIMVKFKEPQRLSIFQAYLLYMLFLENKKPNDYAQYHKCIAGKKFIDNILEVRK